MVLSVMYNHEFPCFPVSYCEEMLPLHPCLQLISNCEQTLSSHTSRRLITMEKVKEPEVCAYVFHCVFGDKAFGQLKETISSAKELPTILFWCEYDFKINSVTTLHSSSTLRMGSCDCIVKNVIMCAPY